MLELADYFPSVAVAEKELSAARTSGSPNAVLGTKFLAQLNPVCWISFIVKVFSETFGKQSVRARLLSMERLAQLGEEKSGAGPGSQQDWNRQYGLGSSLWRI